jgi:DNA-binding transcriptional ArsR family regulator
VYIKRGVYKRILDMPIENEQARLLTCIGEPTRLQILKLLSQGEKYVGEIVEVLGIGQSLVSYHLRHLRECNIVIVRQEAQRTYYRLSDARLAELVLTSEAIVKEIFLCRLNEDADKKRSKQITGAEVSDKILSR